MKSILIVGAGPIVIGQACEFDYSGTQAVKILKQEGYRVILINSNPATIMTDPSLSDATYIEPITPEILEKIIIKEKPDMLLPTMGGQTALNIALQLYENGVLAKYNVELIGASPTAIKKAEDRDLFNKAMAKIGLEVPRNAIAHNIAEATDALAKIGLPAIIRPSFTLGGGGGGIANTEEEYYKIVKRGLEESPISQVLIDESLLGWKEYEMEVVRDKKDNAIIICSIENIDPMGVHTGDSITVAPALTLTDKEYQKMRDASIAVLREIGVETGGSNVQFAINPKDGRMIVIEMNPRVSRSSALASKATGFPIAKVATKLAIGYSLEEIMNDCTKATPASFEPSIDYVVTKIPRFAFEKFASAKKELGSAMKSVGEVMAIGGNFKESLQKALRSLEIGVNGFEELEPAEIGNNKEQVIAKITNRLPNRILYIAQAFRFGLDIEEVHKHTMFDLWFLREIKEIIDAEEKLKQQGFKEDFAYLYNLKHMGFSDARIAQLTNKQEVFVRETRHNLGLHPVYNLVDTCAAEFASETPYMYSTYQQTTAINDNDVADVELNLSDACVQPKEDKIVIIGSGPNRIGQGIEFDYACVHAVYAYQELGYQTIMVNCNPETVSTDYDTADKLYFEPLTEEDVLEVLRAEGNLGGIKGVNIQFGGQTPLRLANALEGADVPLLGTSNNIIDLAEDREQFKDLLHELGLKQPENDICQEGEDPLVKARLIGFPLVVRPSFVLGGRAMAIIHSKEELQQYLTENAGQIIYPLLLDEFLKFATEIDVDAICDGEDVYIAGIMEHIEEAGIHSGDSACSLPSFSLKDDVITEIKAQTRKIGLRLKVQGMLNIQYAVMDDDVYIIEVNPRASRTVPFVAKARNIPVAKIAAKIMAGHKIAEFKEILTEKPIKHTAVKEAVFPFNKFPNVDILLGPEMKSTGEVMGIDKGFAAAFAKAQIAAGNHLPTAGNVFISVKDEDKSQIIETAHKLQELGFHIYSTKGTAKFLQENGVKTKQVNKVAEGNPHIVDMIKMGQIALVINTTGGITSIKDSFSIRRNILSEKLPHTTTITGAKAIVKAIEYLQNNQLQVKSLQEL